MYLQRLVLICEAKHLVNQNLAFSRSPEFQALFNYIRSKFVLTHLYDLARQLSYDVAPFVCSPVFKNMLSDKGQSEKKLDISSNSLFHVRPPLQLSPNIHTLSA